MNVLVDTSVWALAFRRRKAVSSEEVVELKRLIDLEMEGSVG